jgi:phage terminase small subunit
MVLDFSRRVDKTLSRCKIKLMVMAISPPKTELLPLQESFCQYYNQCHNSAAAAVKAGYALDGARKQGWQLLQLPHILARLKELDAAKEFDPDIASANERRKILSEIARASVTDYQTANGLEVNANSPNTRSIRAIDVDGSGKVKRIKLADAVAAIQEHNKMDGIGRDSPPVTDARTVIINVTGSETRAMLGQVVDCLLPDDTSPTSGQVVNVIPITTTREGQGTTP